MLRSFVNSNSIMYTQPNTNELSNKQLGALITEATAYLECHMSLANLKQLIAENKSRKAFFKLN